MPRQQYIRVIYTARLWNPLSWLIRWMVGPSKLSFQKSSHGIVVDGDSAIEANMIYGVREVPLAVAIKGARIVREAYYPVRDAKAGLDWYRGQKCAYVPQFKAWVPGWLRKVLEIPLYLLNNNYDFKGAFGMGFAPDRDWQDPSKWSCYEGCAGTITAAGSDVLSDCGFITETTLWSIRHVVAPPLLL
jgi:hypothetical protein